MGNTLHRPSKKETQAQHEASATQTLIGGDTGGAATPTNTTPDSIDAVVAYYILSMDLHSLKDTQDTNESQVLQSLTADAICNTVSHDEILAKRNFVKDASATKYTSAMCKDVAWFYVGVAKLFSSIVLAINPEYTYTDDKGARVAKSLHSKGDIPFDQEFNLSKLSFCGSRIASLEMKEGDGSAKVCTVNVGETANANTLEDQLGIPELHDLYCDADYDDTTQQFLGMTEKTKAEYQSNLREFYQTFTGESSLPNSIKRFGDIPLNKYNQMALCDRTKTTPVDDTIKSAEQQPGTESNCKNALLSLYAINLRNMIQRVNTHQLALIDILNTLFVTVGGKFEIHPDLTEKTMQRTTMRARALLTELYMSCEMDYLIGMNIYEAIADAQMLSTGQRQIDYLEKLHESILHDTKYAHPIQD